MDLGLRDRVYVVTGASRGLGRASAIALAAEGARLVLCSRDEESLNAVAQELGGHENAIAVAGDLSQEDTAGRLVAAANARWDRLDGALISVGGPKPGPVIDITDDDWRGGFETVFLGPLRVARAVAAGIGADGGSMVFVLSSSVKQPVDGLATSNGLRPGVAMTAKTMADELGPRGIRVNGLLPGRIDTDRIRELDALSGKGEKARRDFEARIPLRRYGDPGEFGRAAAFLLSPAASYITGVMLPVDGGLIRSV
ncbi:MAG: 3-oxoacyl-[acyl-carrier protein] reductase [Nocardioidaceae bacterium]|nr:3-oxoacyl-[acyl-carrier protein] reductase [Nocardioidaceae bacterium]